MKKNIAMRLASGLMLSCLLSTCVISGTFAKYVTSGEATDSARVAKWGVTVEGKLAAANVMFKSEYDETGSVTVDSTVDVVAPGTGGTLTAFDVSGTPEVDVTVTYVPVVELGDNWIDKYDLAKFYCPVTFTVSTNSGTDSICGLDYASADAFEDAIEALIVAAQGYYDAGTNLETAVEDDLTVSWNWAFENATGSENDQDNEKDTFLGDRAAQLEANAATISVSVKVTVTQVD